MPDQDASAGPRADRHGAGVTGGPGGPAFPSRATGGPGGPAAAVTGRGGDAGARARTDSDCDSLRAVPSRCQQPEILTSLRDDSMIRVRAQLSLTK